MCLQPSANSAVDLLPRDGRIRADRPLMLSTMSAIRRALSGILQFFEPHAEKHPYWGVDRPQIIC
jgi:hypothetical protein